MAGRISQREARRLRKQVAALEARERGRRNAWQMEYPGGVHLCTTAFGADLEDLACLLTARKLGCAVVAVPDTGNKAVRFYGVRL